MVLNRRLVRRQHVGGEPAPERMGAKRTERDRRGERERGGEQASPGVHRPTPFDAVGRSRPRPCAATKLAAVRLQ